MTRRRFPPPNGGRRLTRPPGWDGAGPVSCGFGGAPQSRGEIGLRREFPNCISDGAESQAPRMAFARGGMSQYALRHMRFADLLPVPRRQGIPRFVEHGAQELNCFWIVRSTISHGGSAPQTSPALSGHRASSCLTCDTSDHNFANERRSARAVRPRFAIGKTLSGVFRTP
jgi:hypothetical protein